MPHAGMSQGGESYPLDATTSATGAPLYAMHYERGSCPHQISKLLEEGGIALSQQGGHSGDVCINRVLGVEELARLPGINLETAVASMLHAAAPEPAHVRPP